MTKFKVGDKVRLVSCPFNVFTMGYEGVVTALLPLGSFQVDNERGSCSEDCWELIPPTEEEKAKETLEALGYTITPPKPKRSGEVVVYEDNSGSVFSCTKAIWDKYYAHGRDYKLVSIAPWTEGNTV